MLHPLDATSLTLYHSTSSPLHLFTSLPLHLSTSLPLHLSTSLPLHLSTSSPLHLFTSLPLYLFASLPLRLSTSSPLYLFTSLPLHLWCCEFLACCNIHLVYTHNITILLYTGLYYFALLNLLYLNSGSLSSLPSSSSLKAKLLCCMYMCDSFFTPLQLSSDGLFAGWLGGRRDDYWGGRLHTSSNSAG